MVTRYNNQIVIILISFWHGTVRIFRLILCLYSSHFYFIFFRLALLLFQVSHFQKRKRKHYNFLFDQRIKFSSIPIRKYLLLLVLNFRRVTIYKATRGIIIIIIIIINNNYFSKKKKKKTHVITLLYFNFRV